MKNLLIAISLGDLQYVRIKYCGRRLLDAIEIGLCERYMPNKSRVRLTDMGAAVVRQLEAV